MISSLPSTRRPNVRTLDPTYWNRPRGLSGRWWAGLSGLGATTSPFVQAMADAIARQEGYGAPNSACTSINNPGCLRAGPGQIGTSAQGFAIFPDSATGYAALDSQIQYNINLGLNMQQFFGGKPGVYPGYAPSADSNNPTSYAANVSSWTGVNDVNTPLSRLQALYDAGNISAATPLPGPQESLLQSLTPDFSGDFTPSTGTDYTPYLLAAAGILVAAVAMR
jgi:hypothetical protein